MRFAAALLVALVLAVPARAATPSRYWSMAHVLHALDTTRIRVGTHLVRVHADTTLCSGQGRSIRRHGARMWSRFACTFTTITKTGIGRDLEFHVDITGRTSFAISDAHWIRGVP
jgi:hypothetical protein